MSPPDASQTLTFRCPKELEGLLPPPIPAAQGLPDWLRTMPQEVSSAIMGGSNDTVKRCPPFVDAMTSGFLIPLICDIKVENGEFSWDNDLPPCSTVNFPRSPIGLHDSTQLTGTPLFESDRFVIKFHNLWTIEAPEGYSCSSRTPSIVSICPSRHSQDGRLRQLSRWLDSFSDAMARHQFQRRIAERNADRSVLSSEAGKVESENRRFHGRRHAANPRSHRADVP
jgi:hypothetical protein